MRQKTALSELGGPEAAAQAETILVSSESGNPEDLIAFDITDLANSPEIQIGDTIVVNREETPQPGDFAAVKLSDNTIMFRRLRFLAIGVSGPQVVLEAINPDFAPMTVTLGKDATVLGVMVEQARHTRGSQRVSVFRPAVS